MATSKILVPVLLLACAQAWSREAASTAQCQADAAKPPIASVLAKAAQDPGDLGAQFALADAWSDVGCFNDAVSVLQGAVKVHPENAELQTRLRVAKSLVGEEHFFDDLDRADTQAKLKRAVFRCENLSDPDACGEALRIKPDDPEVLAALDKIHAAQARSPAAAAAGAAVAPGAAASDVRMARSSAHSASGKSASLRRYSNSAPPGQTH
jgi:cytochrome c-type biogenesis protein CcmH/NrfG